MSGVKRTIEDNDPDYEEISITHQNKRHKAIETSARDAAICKIETVVKEQFALEMKNKEHEIQVIDQRLNEARRMMDRLRAYIVANYYASAGLGKSHEGTSPCDPTVLNHPSIRKFLESPSRASSPANHRSDTPSVNNSETDSVCTHSELLGTDSLIATKIGHKGTLSSDGRPGKGSMPAETAENQTGGLLRSEDTSRRFIKKTLIVGNVSKYIPPDKREENDQSTHKWMVHVRGSRKEPAIDHFVKKVWFFLHPSYKPNDLVEVGEPPFHLTRRGWGEFPVRVQIHFKDSQNKRIDIIHNLKLDRTYTGLQTLGAETVVEVELLRHSLGEDYLYSQSSNESSQSDGSTPMVVKTSSPQKGSHDSTDKGLTMNSEPTFHTQASALERTPTKMTQRFTIGAHGSTAFQPITASCKIVPQGQATSLAESPGKSFQPITMSCKIVSGSPTSKHSNASQAGTRSPLPKIHGSSFVTQNIKQEDSLFAAMPPLCPIGSSKSQSPKTVAGGLGAFTKVIIKQEPVETSQQQQEPPSTSQPSLQQIVTVKGNQIMAVSPQKSLSTAEGAKVVSIPVGSAVQASIKPSVTISGGQILVAKPGASAAKAVAAKQMVSQGVAKAVVSSGSASVLPQSSQNIKAQVASAVTTKAGSQGSVMATLQLPSTNLGNLANLPPGTKLYLTTNSKNTSGKGKLLLIPQGAILRAASTANVQPGASSSGGSGTTGASSGLPQHLTYTSYILKQTPQGTFLVGQPSPQTSGKQATSNIVIQGSAGTSAQGQQTIKLTAGQKSALITQANSGSAGLVKISENVLKSLPVTAQAQKPGTALLRGTGGVLTAASASLLSLPSNGSVQQATEGSSNSTQQAPTTKIQVQHTATASTSQVKSLTSAKSSTLPAPVLSSRVALSPIPNSSAPTVKAEADHSSTLPFHSTSVVKVEDQINQEPGSVMTEHLQNIKQLLTATVKKVPLIGERDDDGTNSFCASTLEQYYSWPIGKRRASEWQRAVAIRKMLEEVIEKLPKFSSVAPLKTKEIVHWCRIHGYTPPDPESASDDQESIEDVLTRIDNEASLSSSYSSAEGLCRKVEELEKVLKKEKEEDEDVDIISIEEERKPHIKKENEDEDDVKCYLTPNLSCEFIRDAAQEIGVSLQPTEIQKNVYASPVEEMMLKATEQFVSDILRDSLAVAYKMTSRKRAPREITVTDIHQAICNIPLFDFLTNRHIGALNMDG